MYLVRRLFSSRKGCCGGGCLEQNNFLNDKNRDELAKIIYRGDIHCMRTRALWLYRDLFTTARRLFMGDLTNHAKAQRYIRSQFRTRLALEGSNQIEEALKAGEEVLFFYKHHIAQAETATGTVSGAPVMTLRLHDELRPYMENSEKLKFPDRKQVEL